MTDCETKPYCDIDPDEKQEAKLKILFEELGFTTEDDLDDDNPDKSAD